MLLDAKKVKVYESYNGFQFISTEHKIYGFNNTAIICNASFCKGQVHLWDPVKGEK